MFDDLQDIIFEGENILWQGKPDKFCFLWRTLVKMVPVAIIWLLFDGFFIFTIISSGAAKEMLWFMIIFFAIHLLPVWKVIGAFIKGQLEHKNVLYAITDKRIIVRNGVIGLDFESINYADISNVRVDVSVIERIKQVGTVFITTASGKSICLLSIPEPYNIYKKINKVFMDVKTDIHYPNALRPDVNPGYKTTYKA